MSLKDWYENHLRDEIRLHGWKSAFTRAPIALFAGFNRRTFEPHIGKSIWAENFDILLVLDATRVDMMKDLQGEYDWITNVESRWSNASCSYDWIERNMKNSQDARSAGYVNANPWDNHDCENEPSVGLNEGEHVAYLDDVWKYGREEVEEYGLELIPPKTVSKRAIGAWRNKSELGFDKLVVHYMQPHQPFRRSGNWGEVTRNLENLMEGKNEIVGGDIWNAVRRNGFDFETVKEAYWDNLRWVLNDIEETVLKSVDAQVHITADHGNALGEWGQWGHPPGVITPQIRKVPYLRVEGSDQGTIDSDFERKDTDRLDSDVEDRLKELGYR